MFNQSSAQAGIKQYWLPFFFIQICLCCTIHTSGQLQNHLIQFAQSNQGEKLFVQTDREEYFLGDTLWFSAWLVNDINHQAILDEKVLYLELCPEDQTETFKRVFEIKNGRSFGQFKLPQGLYNGKYTLSAYTPFLKKQHPESIFQKKITLYNLDDNEPIINVPVRKNTAKKSSASTTQETSEKTKPSSSFQFSLMPEGGSLVHGIPTKVAFIAQDSTGIRTDFSGQVLNKNGEFAAFIQPSFKNRGYFYFTPDANDTHKVKIQCNNGDSLIMDFPEVQAQGYSLQVENKHAVDEMQIKVLCSPNLIGDSVYLAAVHRYQLLGLNKINMAGNQFMMKVSKKQLPDGLIQLTLFNKHFKPICERLVFINNQKQLQVSVSRQEDSLQIKTTYPNDQPAQGNFAISVTNQSFINDTNTICSNISRYLNLRSELPGLEPDCDYFYADDRASHLKSELTLLTNGWRKYSWNQILNKDISTVQKKIEPGFYLSGVIKNRYKGETMPEDTEFSLFTSDLKFIETTFIDSAGAFDIPFDYFYGTYKVFMQAKHYKKQKPLGGINLELSSNLILDDSYNLQTNIKLIDEPAPQAYIYDKQLKENATKVSIPKSKITTLEKIQKNDFFIDTTDVQLETVSVTAKREKSLLEILKSKYGLSDYKVSTKMVSLIDEQNSWNSGVMSVLDKLIPSLVVQFEDPYTRKDPFKGEIFPPAFDTACEYSYHRDFYRLMYNNRTNNRIYIYVDGDLAAFTNQYGQVDWIKNDMLQSMDMRIIKYVGFIENPPKSALGDALGAGKTDYEIYCMKKYLPYLRSNNPMVYRDAPEHIISIETKTGKGIFSRPANEKTMSMVIHGFSHPKQFYTPLYDFVDKQKLLERPTIYWNPNIITDKNGEATVPLPFNLSKDCQININGISYSGTPGHALVKNLQ